MAAYMLYHGDFYRGELIPLRGDRLEAATCHEAGQALAFWDGLEQDLAEHDCIDNKNLHRQ